ncbi:hypothetical protein STIAU_4549, partial [Stigmatella aurantiaca DW4/3-1]
EDGLGGLLERIDEQRHRGLHLRPGHPGQECVRFGRSFDEHRVGLKLLERGPHAARAARPVVPYAEHVDLRARFSAHSTSMHAR